MNTKQYAVIRKDIRGITANKQVLAVMLGVPLALTIVVPSIFVLVTALVPEAGSEFEPLLNKLPFYVGETERESVILGIILNKIMPAFFLLIPIMASSVMAASSFVGEKEKHTLETLLYSPLSLKELFRAKILAGFTVGMTVCFISFAAMLVVVEAELFFLTGSMIAPDLSWLMVMLLVSPSVSIIAIALTVRSSAKAQTVEEAQHRAVFLVFPIIALAAGQFTGVILLNPLLLLVVGLVLALLAAFLMKRISERFAYETLLI